MSWDEERSENAYFLKKRKEYSSVFSRDIRKLFEDRMTSLEWKNGFKWGFRGYEDEELSQKYSDFYNGFRLGEDYVISTENKDKERDT